MKFTEHLGAHLTPEWRSQYIQYEEMKKLLYDAVDNAPLTDGVNEEILRRHYAKHDEGFFMFCDKEVSKVNTFFAEKLAEATRKFHELVAEVGVSNESDNNLHLDIERGHASQNGNADSRAALLGKSKRNNKKLKGARKLKELKFAVSEFYLSLVLIQNFQLFKTETGVNYRKTKVETAPFFTNKLIADLILETEGIFINELEGGDRTKAMKRLRVLPLEEKQTNQSSFLWGLYSGVFLVLFIVVIITAYYKRPKKNWQPALRMYRGWFLIVTMTGLLGINTYGWSKAGVNHKLIFELDPRDHITYIDLLKVASLFGSLMCLSALAFLFSADFNLPQFAQPLILTGFILLFLLNPTKTFHKTSRYWFIKVMIRILAAPWFVVKFADFWLADQLNSLVVPLLDFQYMFCFYAYDWHRTDEHWQCTNPQNIVRPLVAILPAWFRLAQCLRRYKDSKDAWPHLVNAGKYSTSIFVTVFSTVAAIYKARTGENQTGTLFYMWVASLLFSTFYTLFWDIRMDWGLLDKNAGENLFLREQIVYDYKIYYYLAAFADLIFRFMWTLTVSVGEAGFINNELFILFVATCEVFRRFVWNFFRLENEHLNNCGNFRAVRDISVKPFNADIKAELAIEKLMDDEHGPLPKRRMVRLLLSENEREEHSLAEAESKENGGKNGTKQNFNDRETNRTFDQDSNSSGDNDASTHDATLLKDKYICFRSTGSIVKEMNGLVYNVGTPVLGKKTQQRSYSLPVPMGFLHQHSASSLVEVNAITHNEHKYVKKPESEKAPFSLHKSEKAPGSLNESEKAPGSLNESEKAPGSLNESEKAPISLNESEKAPVSLNESEKAPGSLNESEKAPGSLNESEKAPVSLNDCDFAVDDVIETTL